MRRQFVGLVLSIVLAACSVATPRDGGWSASGQSRAVADATGAYPSASEGLADPAAQVAESGPGAAGDGTSPLAGQSALSSGGRRSGDGGSASAAPGATGPLGSTVGVTDDSIVISLLAGFSGPYGGLFQTWADNAFGTWVDERNDTGGINGRKIILHQVDNHDTAEGGVAACKEVQSNGSFLAISMAGIGGADMSSSDCLDRAKIPIVAFNLASYRSNWRYVVSVNDDAKQAVPMASFVKNVIGDAKGKTGMIVVNDPIQIAARDAIRSELARLRMTHVSDEMIAVGQGSFVAELSRLRDAGATTVIMVTGTEAIGIVRDANAIGYRPNFTGMFWTLDEFSQAAGELWDGIKAIRVFSTTDSPAYARYQKTSAKYGHNVSSTTTMAYYGGGVLIAGIIEKVGRALGRDGFIKQAGQTGKVNNGYVSIEFPPGQLLADVHVFPLVCCNADNTWKSIGEPKLEF